MFVWAERLIHPTQVHQRHEKVADAREAFSYDDFLFDIPSPTQPPVELNLGETDWQVHRLLGITNSLSILLS
jgi:hypothetical protein